MFSPFSSNYLNYTVMKIDEIVCDENVMKMKFMY